ncbi:dynein axonemal intermediate chain 2-like [Cydia pomonella]|uniref:dynein axonemal intermediate chain 2-like n=1 Tax=Cydia pomonella TaxID=82600 RepID=UPI002ADE3D43|nr:dynein axonemal intermediate chain 2-like [Cydia pomonella]
METYSYIKKRRDFGKQPMFCEHGPELCDSILPNPAEQKVFILRNPVHQAIQNTPNFSQHEINTKRAKYTTTGINHAEGGWPKDVNVVDPEATQRYRRKIEKEDEYISCVNTCCPGMEHYALQNNAIDMYQIYYSDMASLPPVEKNSMRTVNVYRDPLRGRPISSICWQPDGQMRFAVTYVDMNFYRNPQGSIFGFLWDVETPAEPFMNFMPPAILLDLQFNPKDSTMLAGGLVTGQVVLFDIRRGSQAVSECPPHVAHRDMVRNVLFINSKSGLEFFSGGPDGACKWWDARNMSEPTDEMIIDIAKYSFDVPNMATAFGISTMEYEFTIPSRFMVGTDNGYVVTGNRKGKTQLDKFPVQYPAHTGSVRSLERNPYFLKNFLTVGDWRLQVWSEDCHDSPVLSTAATRHKITCATWSPTRCSLLLCTGADGVISAWDFLRSQCKPILTMYLGDDPLVKVRIHEQGSLVAVGTQKGSIFMLELSPSMTASDKNDKNLMLAIFERETKREKILEARLREIRLKQRQAEEGSPRHSLGLDDPSVGDRDLAEATQDYLNVVKKELAAM